MKIYNGKKKMKLRTYLNMIQLQLLLPQLIHLVTVHCIQLTGFCCFFSPAGGQAAGQENK